MEIVLPYLFGMVIAAALLKALWPKRRLRARYSDITVARQVAERLYDERPAERRDTGALADRHPGLDRQAPQSYGDPWDWNKQDDFEKTRHVPKQRDAA